MRFDAIASGSRVISHTDQSVPLTRLLVRPRQDVLLRGLAPEHLLDKRVLVLLSDKRVLEGATYRISAIRPSAGFQRLQE
jgi:hypothetical protein